MVVEGQGRGFLLPKTLRLILPESDGAVNFLVLRQYAGRLRLSKHPNFFISHIKRTNIDLGTTG